MTPEEKVAAYERALRNVETFTDVGQTGLMEPKSAIFVEKLHDALIKQGLGVRCMRCDGVGGLTREMRHHCGHEDDAMIRCPNCRGSGKVYF